MSRHVAGELRYRHLQAQAEPEIRDLVLAGIAGRQDLALDAADAEAAGDEDAVRALQLRT